MNGYELATFCAVYFAAVATPGPGIAAVISQGLGRGLDGAPAFIAGFVAGDLIWFLAASLGLSALAQTAHAAFVAARLAGAAYLMYLAYRLWTSPVQPLAQAHTEARSRSPRQLFMGSLTLTLGNPKPMLFFVALLPTVVSLDALGLAGYVEIGTAIAVILPATLSAYVLAAARARLWFQSARARRFMNRGSGTLMAAAAVAVVAR